jgi:hypothetical protein
MRPARLALILGLLLAFAPAAQTGLTVSNDRTALATKLGHKFVFHSTIHNNGTGPAGGLVAHLNVVDLSGHTYVDPEDWSSHRTRYLAPIRAGASTTVSWPMNAVNSGTIGVYVAVLPRSGAPVPPTTGPTLRVRSQDRKTLNSAGILPLALGLPALLGLVALSVHFRRARSERRTS